MMELASAPRSILCLGAHSDDLEIGCAGTVMQLLEARSGISVHWVVFSAGRERAGEARAAARQILTAAGKQRIEVEDFRDGYFPWQGDAIKDRFEVLRRAIEPDIIFTHAREDRHQDHRMISDLTWNTYRDHLILEYEIPKYDGELAQPNTYVPLTDSQVSRKIEILMDCFPSQQQHAWFDAATFGGLMRLRGVECNAASGYAEAFQARKLRLAVEASR